MININILHLENILTRQSFTLLLLAVVYGIVAGAVITMYYAVVPGMDRIEDKLALVQITLYTFSVVFSFIHLPRALWDIKNKGWKQAFVQVGLFLGPILVFLGSEGLVSHLLWWESLSDTDQFHMLHHTVLAGTPLTILYWLALRRWWVPNSISDAPNSKAFLTLSVLIILIFTLIFGVMFGSLSMAFTLLAGLLVVVGWTVKSGSRAAS